MKKLNRQTTSKVVHNIVTTVAYPRYWNPGMYIVGILFFIALMIGAMIDSTKEIVKTIREFVEDTQGHVYSFKEARWLTYAESLNITEQKIKESQGIKAVNIALRLAAKYDVEEKVILNALRYARKNPNALPSECFAETLKDMSILNK